MSKSVTYLTVDDLIRLQGAAKALQETNLDGLMYASMVVYREDADDEGQPAEMFARVSRAGGLDHVDIAIFHEDE